MSRYVLTVACVSRRGIVAAIAAFLAENGCNITDSSQFDDMETGRFFMRVQVQSGFDRSVFEHAITPIANSLGAEWVLDYVGRRRRTLVLASRAGHCLNDLLFRTRSGHLPITIPLILAIILSMVDVLDAKLHQVRKAIADDDGDGEFFACEVRISWNL